MWKEPWLHTLLGGLVTALIAWGVYVRSTRDLRQEAAELKRMTEILLRGMARAGWVRVRETPDGRLVELIIASANIVLEPVTIQATGTVRPPTTEPGPPAGSA